MSDPSRLWGPEQLKTAADVRRMLNGLPPLTEEGAGVPVPQEVPGLPDSSTPQLPAGAVSATAETVDEQPLNTTETVQVVAPAKPKRRR